MRRATSRDNSVILIDNKIRCPEIACKSVMRRSFDDNVPAGGLAVCVGATVIGGLFFGCATRDAREVRNEVTPLYSAASPTFRQATGSLLGSGFVSGNNIVTLVNGREVFPAMLSAIRSARQSINFETYTYWDGETARMF